MTMAEQLDLYRELIITQGLTRSSVLAAVGPGMCWLWPFPSLCVMTLLTLPCPAEEMTEAEISV